MGIVSKVQTLGMQNPALITSTLFGRCSTAANVAEKVVTISNDSFLESALMDGMSLRVFFEYGNTCDAPTLIIKNSNQQQTLVRAIPIRAFHLYLGEYHDRDVIDNNFVTTPWADGGVISFTYMRKDPNNAGTTGYSSGDYWLIDNQSLSSNYAYGYQSYNSTAGKTIYFVDAQYGLWDVSQSPAALAAEGYQNPHIKSGRYIYSFNGKIYTFG